MLYLKIYEIQYMRPQKEKTAIDDVAESQIAIKKEVDTATYKMYKQFNDAKRKRFMQSNWYKKNGISCRLWKKFGITLNIEEIVL